MKDTDVPTKFPIRWAQDAPGSNITNPVPRIAGQPDGHASFPDGYPPINSTPIASGGIPPWGSDTNGVLFMLSDAERWYQAGAPYPYDSTFQTLIGGYPKGAIVASDTANGRYWINEVNDNLTDPDLGGANWVRWGSVVSVIYTAPGSYIYFTPAFCSQIFIRIWGGGGGGSGSDQGGASTIGASGAGGGYFEGYFSIDALEGINSLIGGGGSAAVNGAQAGDGGHSSVTGATSGLLGTATGGGGANAGRPLGGTGIGSGLGLTGQAGTDLDSQSVFQAIGGSAPMGGFGGNLSTSSVSGGPTWPGGGGAANYFVNLGTAGAAGGVALYFKIGP